MSKKIATIPLEQIDRVQVYVNTGRKSLAAVKQETGADYILNGGLYNRSKFTALCHLRADGYTYAADQYSYFGYLWDQGPDMAMGLVPDERRRNYICCVALIRQGKAVERLIYNADMGGARPRSAMGTKDGKLCLYAGSDPMTPEGLRDYLAAQGWRDGVMLDGGGSTQCDLNGQTITSARRVHNLICVYLNKETEDKPMGAKTYSLKADGNKALSANFKVREFRCKDGNDTILIEQTLVNLLQELREHFGKAVTITSGYRTKSHNDAVGGSPKSQHLLGYAADIVISGVTPLEVAGYAASLMPGSGGVGLYKDFTHVDVRDKKTRWDSTSGKEVAVNDFVTACPYKEPTANIKQGSTGAGAQWVQWQLNRHGASLTVDGIFGAKSVAALKSFQKSKGLTNDGICGKSTRAKLKV